MIVRVRRGLPLLLITALVLIWELIVRWSDIPQYILPAPSQVLLNIFDQADVLFEETCYTAAEAALGLIVGALTAMFLGAFASRFSLVERTVMPIAILVKVTPILAIAPLFAIWFGFGMTPRILIVAIVTFFPMLVNTILGLRSADKNTVDYMRSLGARESEILFRLRVPFAAPYMFASLKISVPLSVIGAVIGEWFGSNRGLGNLIMVSHGNLEMGTLFASVFLLAFIGIIAISSISFIEKRTTFWHPASESIVS
ncbi:ABC transporter permease [Dehalococcoidia bacterium]|nr:ABC transporter permease [Dehalococcoidia bacterium]